MNNWRDGLKRPYKDVANIFARYWRAYGGWHALFTSPYLHMAILVSLVLRHSWLETAWWETASSVIPNIIGFTLAGFTIWLGFGNEQFQHILSQKRAHKEFSNYIVVSATFVHFILVGAMSLLAALFAKATAFCLPADNPLNPIMPYLAPIGHFIGYTFFTYALMTAIAATMGVFRLAFMFDRIRQRKPRAHEGTVDAANRDNTDTSESGVET